MIVYHPASAVLIHLRELLIKDGWLQRHMGEEMWRGSQEQRDCAPKDDRRGWCPHKAIIWMPATTKAKGDAIRLLAEQVGGKTSVDFLRWNDARTTTKGDVLALIDRAIDRAKEAAE